MINWDQIDRVFLDMDGTLLDLHYDNYFWLTHLPRRYAELKNISLEASNDKLDQMFKAYRGTLRWYCLDFWASELDIDLIPLKYEVAEKVGYRPGAKRFLSFIRSQGLPAILVTNAHQGSVQVKFDHTDIESHLDRVITSHSLSLPKEDPAFWEALQTREPFDPSRTLFVDDNEDVLKSAETYGFKHLYSIAQPDSGHQARETSRYPMITDFSEVVIGH